MFVRFEQIQRPNSYNDSPISSLSWMRNEADIPPLPHTLLGGGSSNPLDNLQSPTSHQHALIVTLPSDHNLDINNNSTEQQAHNHLYHQHHHNQQHNHRNFESADSFSLRSQIFSHSGSLDDELHAKDGWLAVGNLNGIVGVSYTTTKAYSFSKSMGFLDPSGTSRLDSSVAHHHHHYMFRPAHNQQRPHLFPPVRTNYNLRGHRAEILFVRWNEPYQKLATCDENGVIFIWIKYEGRWSIELINDRNTRVTDIAWSHDGRMALICYLDGFVLVGSVSGQRYWSSMLNLADCQITCGTWTPTDQHVLFGTDKGNILVISVHGNFVTQVVVQERVAICAMAWSCPRFAATAPRSTNNGPNWLAVSFANGTIFLLRNYDDLDPKIIATDLVSLKMDWSSDGRVLAVGGHRLIRSTDELGGEKITYHNVVHFYSMKNLGTRESEFDSPCLVPFKSVVLEYQLQPMSALSWGNYDRRIYVACGQLLYVGWIFLTIPSLSFLARHKIAACLREATKVDTVPVPEPIRISISELFSPTICCYLPDYTRIRDFVFHPPPNQIRLYCTLIRHEDESACATQHASQNGVTTMVDNATYILYLEYLGGLVPILKGKRSSKIKTEFVIYDPELPRDGSTSKCKLNVCLTPRKPRPNSSQLINQSSSTHHSARNSSDSESEESFAFPYLTPKTRRRLRNRSAQLRRYFRGGSENLAASESDLICNAGRRSATPTRARYVGHGASRPSSASIPLMEDMPEKSKIVSVTSNIWGTKFKFVGQTPMLPRRLGSMTYRTSFLHLQPRQMALVIKELNKHNTKTQLSNESIGKSTHYGSSTYLAMSDSEDEYASDSTQETQDDPMDSSVATPAIAPMQTPLKSIRNSMFLTTVPIPLDDSEMEIQQQQPERPLPEPDSAAAQSIIESRLANATKDEFLTLQISEPAGYGKPIYQMEINSAPSRRKPREPETYQSPVLMSPNSPDKAPGTSAKLPTMLQQFRHQTFQAESPKHVPKILTSAVSKLSSPNISPSKNIRQKITSMKESPRKSSVSYCSSEFSTPIKNYIQQHQQQSSFCDNQQQASKFKSCSSEAYSASQQSSGFLTSSLSPSYSAEPISAQLANAFASSGIGSSPLALLSGSTSMPEDAQLNQNDGSRPNSSLSKSMQPRSATTSSILPSTYQTYHIYDDTNGSSVSIASQRRRQFQYRAASAKLSKSFDSQALKTPGDPFRDSLDQEQRETNAYLQNVEQVVKLLSDKLSAAAVAKEAEFNAELAKKSQSECIEASDSGLTRRNSLPFNKNQSANLPQQPPATPRRTAKKPIKSHISTSVTNIDSSGLSEIVPENQKSRLDRNISRFQHQSLPASPVPAASNSTTVVEKRQSKGRHFFHSPNVIKKMRRKLSYLDCSSEEDQASSSDEDEDVNSLNERLKQIQLPQQSKSVASSAQSSATSTPNSSAKPKRKFAPWSKGKHDSRDKTEEGEETKEFVLHNKAPLWNEVTQVYQLDFGGRVTQESAKNFQIENQGRQVMQFGRIEKNSYTLDFEYPFSAVQALSVALANVTQRFK